MKRTPPLPLLMALVVLTPAFALGAGSRLSVSIADGLSCEASLPVPAALRAGTCLPMLLEFTNTGEERAIRTVIVSNGSISATTVAPPGTTRKWVYLPVVGETLWGVELQFRDAETGRLLAEQAWDRLRLQSGGEAVILYVATGQRPSLSSELTGVSDQQSIINIGPSLLPDSWLGLTAIDLLIVTHDAWEAGRQRLPAVLEWVAMGGTCVIVDAPPEARDGVYEAAKEALPLVERDRDAVVAGMGRLVFVSGEALGQPQPRLFPRGAGAPSFASTAQSGSTGRPPLDVVQKPPFLPVLFFLVVFSLLVGPVGWWYIVSRKGRPLMYYALAPLLSVSVVFLVVVMDLMKQGIRPRASCVAAELLDQRLQKRITLSQFGVYCPFTLGRSLEGRADELPHFLTVAGGGRYSGSSPYLLAGISFTPTDDGVAYADALPARKKTWYAAQSIRLERLRLDIRKEEGRIAVENHLGAPLRDLVVCLDGEYAAFDSLREGGSAAAEPIDRDAALARCREVAGASVSGDVTVRARKMNVRWMQAFQDGENTYIARRDGEYDDLIWLDSARFANTDCVIRGIH